MRLETLVGSVMPKKRTVSDETVLRELGAGYNHDFLLKVNYLILLG
jgi:hypothetical protein